MISEHLEHLPSSLNGIQSGAIIGFLLGLAASFNLPSFSGFMVQTLAVTAVFAGLGYVKENYSWKWTGLGVFLVFIGFFAMSVNSCSLYGKIPEPERNPLTSEIENGGFDGFRLMNGCDRGEYPWYYSEVGQEELEAYCSSNPGSSYCATRENSMTAMG